MRREGNTEEMLDVAAVPSWCSWDTKGHLSSPSKAPYQARAADPACGCSGSTQAG